MLVSYIYNTHSIMNGFTHRVMHIADFMRKIVA